uniref:Uncharacterized protein n=1 Tax=Romanomermis culicivorax TaxID=13658 RepID=A0A915JLT8_ROMCU
MDTPCEKKVAELFRWLKQHDGRTSTLSPRSLNDRLGQKFYGDWDGNSGKVASMQLGPGQAHPEI